MFERMYADEPDNWQPIEEDVARDKLSGYYNNLDDVIQAVKDGQTIRTPFAFYRWQPAEVAAKERNKNERNNQVP